MKFPSSSLLTRAFIATSLLASAFTSTAQVTGWGWNSSSEFLTTATGGGVYSPVALPGLEDLVGIEAGQNGTGFGVRPDGSVVGWGSNGTGQFRLPAGGDPIISPLTIPGLPAIAKVYGGGFASYALSRDGRLFAWGGNGFGGFGNGLAGFYAPSDPEPYRNVPLQVPGATNIAQVEASTYSLGIVKNDGTVWVTGYNRAGALGLGDLVDRNTLTPVSGLTGVKAISLFDDHGLAVTADGDVYSWGRKESGALGTADYIDRPTPERVSGLPSVQGLSKIVSVATGFNMSFALDADGVVYSWGVRKSNFGGAFLGREALTDAEYSVPGRITALPPIASLHVRGRSAYVLSRTGEVYVISADAYNFPFPGFTPQNNTPRQVVGIGVVAGFSNGGSHSYALAGTSRLTGIELLEPVTNGYRNTRARLTLDRPAPAGGTKVTVTTPYVTYFLPNGLPTANTRLKLDTVPSPNPAARSLWRVRNTSASSRTFTWIIFGTNEHATLTVPPNSDAYFGSKALECFPSIAFLFGEDSLAAISVARAAVGETPLNLFSGGSTTEVTVPEGAVTAEFDIFAPEVPVDARIEVTATKGADTFKRILRVRQRSDRPTP